MFNLCAADGGLCDNPAAHENEDTADPTVRKAILLGIDRQAIIKAVAPGDHHRPAGLLDEPRGELSQQLPASPTTAFDPTQANAMLDSAGDARNAKCGARAGRPGLSARSRTGPASSSTSAPPATTRCASTIGVDDQELIWPRSASTCRRRSTPNVPAATFFDSFADGGPLATHAFDMALYTVGLGLPGEPDTYSSTWHGDCGGACPSEDEIPSSADLGVGHELQRAQRHRSSTPTSILRGTTADLTARAHDYGLADQRARRPAAGDSAVSAGDRQHVLVEPAAGWCRTTSFPTSTPRRGTAPAGTAPADADTWRRRQTPPVYSALVRQVSERALDAASAAGASYADCRVINRTVQQITVKNGVVASVELLRGRGRRHPRDRRRGVGIRRASTSSTRASVEEAARHAVPHREGVVAGQSRRRCGSPRRRRSSASTGRPSCAIRSPSRSTTRSDLLLRTDEAMSHLPQIRIRECSLEFVREERHFASSEGALLDQTIIESGGGLDATATSDDEVQTRSFPNSFGRHQVCAGWEAIEAFDLPGNAGRIAEEAVALLSAPIVSRRDHDRDPRRDPGGAAGARVVRPSDRARPRARSRGGIRRDVVPDPRPARHVPLRQRARDHDRRLDASARARHLRLGRRGRGGAAVGARRPGHLHRLPLIARDRRRDRPAEQRHDARRRLVAPADHPHDQHQPRAGNLHASRR